jgi:hypothetical protein
MHGASIAENFAANNRASAAICRVAEMLEEGAAKKAVVLSLF